MTEDESLKYDIRADRLKDIAEYVRRTELAYRQLQLKDKGATLGEYEPQYSIEDFHTWFGNAITLWKVIRPYAEKEQREEIDSALEEFREFLYTNSGEGLTVHDLEQLHDKINEIRIEVGLDIPKERALNPENAGVEGLDQ